MVEYLKVVEAATRARVSTKTIRRWIADGELAWINVSNGSTQVRIRIADTALDDLMRARTQTR